MVASWFTDKDFTSLEIRKYKSLADHRVVGSVRVTDLGYVNGLAARIEQIPANGDMMVSWARTAEHIELLFYSGHRVQVVTIIQKGFKTPSTGFNGGNELEKEIYAEIEAALMKLHGH